MMKDKILWIDLAVCSVWVLAICGCRLLFGSYIAAAVLFMVVAMRLTFSFAMERNERRAWLPLLVTLAGLVLLVSMGRDYGVQEMIHYPFHILNVDFNRTVGIVIGLFTWIWLFVLPLIAFIVQLCRKCLTKTELRWGDLCGGLLWKGHKARTYSAIIIVGMAALFTGLSMSMRMCLLMCVVAPTLTYWLLCRHYAVPCSKAWVVVIGMLVFFAAGQTAGIVRVALLAVSFATVVYICALLYKATKSHLLAVCAMLYIGVLLPSMSIGYNQYTCLNYARLGYYPAVPYNGVFYIKDSTGELYGLRDRYKIILEPIYEGIDSSHRGSGFWCSVFEVKRNGYTRIYDVTNNRFLDECTIDDSLQTEVGNVVKQYFVQAGSDIGDRCEVVVKNTATNKQLAHIKISMHGNPFYDYNDKPFLPADSVDLQPCVFVRDSLCDEYSHKAVLGYAIDVSNDSTTRCRIVVKLAKDNMPSEADVKGIAETIANSEAIKAHIR